MADRRYRAGDSIEDICRACKLEPAGDNECCRVHARCAPGDDETGEAQREQRAEQVMTQCDRHAPRGPCEACDKRRARQQGTCPIEES